MVNGYVTLDLASKNIYNESIRAKASGKPIMVVDAPNVYFADTISVQTIDDDKVVVITKGGKTITINDANAVSSEGEIQNHLYRINFRANIISGDDVDVYVVFDLYTNIKPNITDNKFDTLKNILVDNGATIDNKAVSISGDEIIGLYVYDDKVMYTSNNDNSNDIDTTNSTIYQFNITQLI